MNTIKNLSNIRRSQFPNKSVEDLLEMEERYMELIGDLYTRGKITVDKYHNLFQLVWFKIHGYAMRDVPMFQPSFEKSYTEYD